MDASVRLSHSNLAPQPRRWEVWAVVGEASISPTQCQASKIHDLEKALSAEGEAGEGLSDEVVLEVATCM